MKKIILLFLFLVSVSQAQPVLIADNFPTTYSATAFRAYTNGYTNGGSGANQVWDYSTINLEPLNYSVSLVPSETIPYADSFPTANYCYRFNDNGLFIYDPHLLDASSFESLSYIFDGFPVSYIDNAAIFQFPYIFNSVINDTYLSSIPDAQINSQIRTYDAYGILITPFGTFNNIMRQKIEGNGETNYIWFTNNPFQIIINGNFENDYVTFWKDTTNLSTNQISISTFSIYPNPTNSDVTIHIDKVFNETYVNVYDVLGKALITNEKFNGDYKNISLKDFASGIYIVKITDNENQVLYTQKIIKN